MAITTTTADDTDTGNEKGKIDINFTSIIPFLQQVPLSHLHRQLIASIQEKLKCHGKHFKESNNVILNFEI